MHALGTQMGTRAIKSLLILSLVYSTLDTFHLFSGWLKELADAYHHELTWIMITNGERTHAKARSAVRREFDVRCNLQR